MDISANLSSLLQVRQSRKIVAVTTHICSAVGTYIGARHVWLILACYLNVKLTGSHVLWILWYTDKFRIYLNLNMWNDQKWNFREKFTCTCGPKQISDFVCIQWKSLGLTYLQSTKTLHKVCLRTLHAFFTKELLSVSQVWTWTPASELTMCVCARCPSISSPGSPALHAVK